MEQNQNNNEIEIDLGELLMALWAKKFIIILAGIATMLVAILISTVGMSKVYQSTTKVNIMNKENSDNAYVSSGDLTSSTQLTKDFQLIMQGREVMEAVIAELDLDMSADALGAMVSVEIPTDARMLYITVSHTQPYMARDIADAVREAGSEKIMEVMPTVNVVTWETADYPENPSSPNVTRNAMLGALIGIALAVFGVLLVYLLDDTIKTPEDVERYLGVGVLGSIPLTEDTVRTKKKGRGKTKAGGELRNDKYKPRTITDQGLSE